MALLRPEDGPDRNARLVELVGALGYSVVFARPGTDLPAYATTENVAANMRPIVTLAAKCQLAIGVYSISDVSGLPLTPEAAVQLRQGPGGDHIVAAKVTEANYLQSTRRFLEHPELRDLKIVQGWDPHIATALGDGPLYDAQGRQRCGVTSGAMSFAIFQYQHMLAAARHDEWQEVELAQQAVTALFRAMQDDAGAFADLQRVKHVMGLGHPLTSQVRPEQVEGVLLALRQLPRPDDRQRLARSLDLMGDGPYRQLLREWI
jgi:dihydrodipicolinate synthase/N-acetylneuraminate lyase